MTLRRPPLERPFPRAIWLLYAALQLALPGVASWADARAEAESLSRPRFGHIEDHGTSRCPRVHDADCAICRVLTTGARPDARAAAPAPPCPQRVDTAARFVAATDAAPLRLGDARAPPPPSA